MTEIMPCPFCGGTATLNPSFIIPQEQFDYTGEFIGMGATLDGDIYPAYVECENCGATGPCCDKDGKEEDMDESAIKAWNMAWSSNAGGIGQE